MPSEVSERDIEFVRNAIADKEHAVRHWFDCIVEELNAQRDRAVLAEHVEELESERDDLKEQVEALQAELDGREAEVNETLEAVMYWLRDFFDHQRVSRSARDVLRQVERALGL